MWRNGHFGCVLGGFSGSGAGDGWVGSGTVDSGCHEFSENVWFVWSNTSNSGYKWSLAILSEERKEVGLLQFRHVGGCRTWQACAHRTGEQVTGYGSCSLALFLSPPGSRAVQAGTTSRQLQRKWLLVSTRWSPLHQMAPPPSSCLLQPEVINCHPIPQKCGSRSCLKAAWSLLSNPTGHVATSIFQLWELSPGAPYATMHQDPSSPSMCTTVVINFCTAQRHSVTTVLLWYLHIVYNENIWKQQSPWILNECCKTCYVMCICIFVQEKR